MMWIDIKSVAKHLEQRVGVKATVIAKALEELPTPTLTVVCVDYVEGISRAFGPFTNVDAAGAKLAEERKSQSFVGAEMLSLRAE